jgi:hypothetical protein
MTMPAVSGITKHTRRGSEKNFALLLRQASERQSAHWR